uniref:Uncharacterized protein n=1 Tax=Anguilla anguilla TaxID=7936 RepID=A0A0E9PRL8_ANGAN
MKRKVDKII